MDGRRGIRQRSLCNISFALLNSRINLVLTLMIYVTFWNLDKVFLTSSSSSLKKKNKEKVSVQTKKEGRGGVGRVLKVKGVTGAQTGRGRLREV